MAGARIARPRVVVTGGDGQLGRWMSAKTTHSQCVELVSLGRADMDITRAESVTAAMRRWRPDVVVNAAAYTNVDTAESNVSAATAINVDGAANVARACTEFGCAMVQISTDYVPGLMNTPQRPQPLPALSPLDVDIPAAGQWSVYARSKHAAELAVQRILPSATIVRTAWVYTGPGRAGIGLEGSDFVSMMLRLARTHEHLTVVDDQWGSPTYAADLANGVLSVAARLAAGDCALSGTVINAVGGGMATWHEMARRTFMLAGLDPNRVRPVSTEEFGRPAPRPVYSVLSTAEWRAAGLQPLPPWHDALRSAMRMAR